MNKVKLNTISLNKETLNTIGEKRGKYVSILWEEFLPTDGSFIFRDNKTFFVKIKN